MHLNDQVGVDSRQCHRPLPKAAIPGRLGKPHHRWVIGEMPFDVGAIAGAAGGVR